MAPKKLLKPLIDKHNLEEFCTIVHAERTVSMDDKPSQVMRHGKGTSMWSAVTSVKQQEADACVSCGNTGALMAISMVRLRKLAGINRPAIAILWPSFGPNGSNVMLDVGADVRADENDLLQFALMGASYSRNGFAVKRPRVGLLNVGTEEHKGRAELKAAHDLIKESAETGQFEFIGFVEGRDIPSDRVDVIVTDGFTGNVALKTAEGTASFIGTALRQSFKHNLLCKTLSDPSLWSVKPAQTHHRSAPGQWWGFLGAQWHCGEIPWRGGRNRSCGGGRPGLSFRLSKV